MHTIHTLILIQAQIVFGQRYAKDARRYLLEARYPLAALASLATYVYQTEG